MPENKYGNGWSNNGVFDTSIRFGDDGYDRGWVYLASYLSPDGIPLVQCFNRDGTIPGFAIIRKDECVAVAKQLLRASGYKVVKMKE